MTGPTRITAVALALVLGASPALAAKHSCKANRAQLQAKVAQRYAVDHVYSLLSDCGLGNLLNFGLGSLGNLLNIKGGCNKPVEMLASQPLEKGVGMVNRVYTEGLQRPVNSRIGQVRNTVRTGDWYKKQPWYKN